MKRRDADPPSSPPAWAERLLGFLVPAGTAGLLVRSTLNLRSLDHGIEPSGTAVFTAAFPEGLFGTDDVVAFLRETLPELRALPAVEAVAASSSTPVIGAGGTRIGRPGDDEAFPTRRLGVTEGWFRAMGTSLLAGRGLRTGEPDAAVVTADLAERLWPAGAPLGRRAVVAGREVRIVGVAERGVYGTASPQPHVFTALDPSAAPAVTLVIRSATSPEALFPVVRSTVRERAPDVPLNSLGSLDDLLDRAQILRRAASALAAPLGFLALVIALVGLYAHFSHYVASQHRAMGVRMAIGAPRFRVLRHTLARGLFLTAGGIVLGTALAAAAGALLRSFLYGVTPADPGVLGSVVLLLVLASVGALLFPARRAASVEPMAILREE